MAEFTNPLGVERQMTARPHIVRRALEQTLTTEQAAQFEAAIRPALRDSDKRQMLETARAELLESGVPDDSPSIVALTSEITALGGVSRVEPG